MAFLFAPPYVTVLDSDGNPVSGAKLYFYATGTTTPASVYSDSGLVTPLANPVVADAAGRCSAVYLDSNVTYRCKVTTAAGATISDVDPIIGLGSSPSIPVSASTTEQLTGTNTAKYATSDSVAALWEQGADVASAGTISLGEGGYFNVTGTTTITDIDFATDKAGRKAWVKFTGILTLTHNASTLILPTGANITTAAGDTACFVSEGSDAVRCVSYNRASGSALAGAVLPNALTMNNGGAGAASGTTFDGSAARTISYNTVGATRAGAITSGDLTIATARLAGRTTAATGAIEEISIGANLSLSAGSLNLATSPSITTPTITGGTITPAATPTATDPGFIGLPQVSKTASYTLTMTDMFKEIYITGTTAAQTITIPANGSVAAPVGAFATITNDSNQNWSIAITTDTLALSPGGTTGTRTLAANGTATIRKVTSTRWWIYGTGLT